MAPIRVDSAVSSPFPQSSKDTTTHAVEAVKTDAAAAKPTCFLSEKAKVTEIDGIRGLLPFETPGVVSFLAGKPNPTTFPFDSIQLNLKAPLAGGEPESIVIDGQDLNNALQYGPSPGLVALRQWLTDFQSEVHGRQAGEEWAVSMGTGCQDLMNKAFHAVLNPGDPILVETPVYSGVLPPLRGLNADMIEIGVDSLGLRADLLEQTLASWPADKKRPRVIYSTPIGCNPSGCSASVERKKEVLAIMKKYDLLMLEDDPYYFLATELIPSYFELEPEFFPQGGHVVRFDSFSKLLSGGMRLGYATGPKDILHAIDVHTAGANLHTSSISQAVALRLLQHWGHAGFRQHAASVAQFYAARRDAFEATAHKHLDGLATWVSPVAGMFLWLDLSPAGITDSFSLIRNEALAKGVLAVPGAAFYPSGRPSSHVRVSFSLIDLEEEVPQGLARLAEVIREKRVELGLE